MAERRDAAPVVGVLHAGELGSTLGAVLRRRGLRVLTASEGRSERTCGLARRAGLEEAGALRDLAAAADVVLSAVPPAAALGVAEAYVAAGPPVGRLVMDLNAVSPATCGEIAAVLAAAGVDFVDGAVHGLAARLPGSGTLYLSGPRAGEAAALFGDAPRVRVLGPEPGRASALKMLISGMAKGVVALFLEMGLAARRAGLLDELLACYRESYPGVMAVVDRMLPTYPRHARRRGEEMREVEETLRALGVEPSVAGGVRSLTTAVGGLGLAERPPGGAAAEWSPAAVLEAIALKKWPRMNTDEHR